MYLQIVTTDKTKFGLQCNLIARQRSLTPGWCYQVR